MKLHTIIFSPTGTSGRIASAVAKGMNLASDCSDATRRELAETKFSTDDIVIMAAPVYGGRMAPIAKERFKGISGDSTPCVLIAVYGNRAFENALNDMAEFAESRGFIPVATAAFVGEHSYSTAATPIACGRPDAADLAKAEEFGRKIAERLVEGEVSAVDVAMVKDIASSEESLRDFRSFVMDYQARQKKNPVKLLPELNAELCNGCGVCVALCPVDAISADGTAVDAAKCIKCCSCVKGCPEGARTLSSPFAPVLSRSFSARKEPVWLIS